ncbi:MAG: ribonuclease R [Firmicutes bacterium]|nr:ribonuclease R [Bacillota bacterium]
MKREMQRITGIIEKHKKGFGFIRQEEGADFFVAPDKMGGAMNGDTVEAEILPPHMTRRSHEARVIQILEHKTTELVGTFEKHKHYGFVIPDDKKIGEDVFVKRDFARNAQTGDKVVAKITRYPDVSHSLEGKITEVIAREGQPGSDVLSLIRAYGLYETFPSRVNAEAKARSREPITEKMISESGRLDLRDKTIFTIDGPTAKDLDDAVSIEMLPNGNYLLGVHIADVSHFVAEDGYLDREALKRGTSVYLINRVVPMLPKALSNGSCSLNEGEDKLTLSCFMEINGEGAVVDHSIQESVIRSSARLVYDDVSDILEKDDKVFSKKYSSIVGDIKLMGELAAILRHRRKQRGSLDFDISEAVITLDEDENPIAVELEERRAANRLIEEFMLVANETVAEHFFWLNYPFVYRIHEKPDPEKIMDLKTYLMNFGIKLKGSADNIYPKTLADIIADIEDKPYESVVNRVMLRTMKKARYSTECEGHFGLAFRYYCHFTSPIRRYPDLIIHRIIKESITGRMTEEKLEKYRMDAEKAADISSKTERKAQELEREVDKMKKAQFMEAHIGEEYDGVVSGVTDFGVYVELPNTIEGMALASELARPYLLGERVRVRVTDARPQEKQIDFQIMHKSRSD